MIPKILHYCWFGSADLPQETSKIIKEWISFHPGWEIKKWDESNSPLELAYLSKAASAGKWANMSNYVRLYALLHYGGIYLDTDMKIVKSLDNLLANECFLGFEEGEVYDSCFWVNNAIMGAVPNHSFVKKCHDVLLAEFDGMEDANLSAPQMVTRILKESYGLSQYGFHKLNDVTLYPSPFFYPIHYKEAAHLADFEKYITPDTYCVHLWARTWLSREQIIAELDSLNLKIQADKKKWETVSGKIVELIQAIGSENEREFSSAIRKKDENTGGVIPEKIFEKLDQKLSDIAFIKAAIEDKSTLELYLNDYKKDVKELSRKIEETRTDLLAKNEIIAAIQETNHQSQSILNKRLDDYKHQSQLLQQSADQAQALFKQAELRNQSLEERITKQLDLIEGHNEVLLATKKHFETAIIAKERLISEVLYVNDVLKKECENLVMQRDFSQNALKKLGVELKKANSDAEKLGEMQMQMKLAWEEKEQSLYVRAIENEKNCEALRMEIDIIRQDQYEKERELENLLKMRIEEKKKAIKWYEDTYVNRSLIGIIKQKMIKRK